MPECGCSCSLCNDGWHCHKVLCRPGAHAPETEMDRQIRRERVIREAISAADRLILAAARTQEEIQYITGAIAEAFLKKALIPFTTMLLKADARTEK